MWQRGLWRRRGSGSVLRRIWNKVPDKGRRGDTTYEIKVRPVKVARGDADDQPAIVKTVGGVALFFHNGPPACRNRLAFQTLWRRTIVKMAFGFFHNGPAGFTI